MTLTSTPDYRTQLTPDAFVVYPDRRYMLLAVLVIAVFVGSGILQWNEGTRYRIGMVVGLILSVFLLLFLGIRSLRRIPSLIVNQTGIFDNTAASASYLVRWEEIESVHCVGLGRQRFLAIRPHDPEGFVSRQPVRVARLMRMNIKLTGFPVTISTLFLPLSLQQLVQVMRQKYPAVHVS